MAENNAIEGLLGEEADEAVETRGGAGDSTALAMAMDAAKYDPDLARTWKS